METAVIGGGGESCDVDVSLSAKPDNLLQSDSSDECSLCVYAHVCTCKSMNMSILNVQERVCI